MADEAEIRRGLGARLGRLTLLSVGPLLLIAGGVYYFAVSGRYVSTENAYLKSDKIAISTDVSGLVAQVAVIENDVVAPGQLLFRIDEERFQIALDRREAELQAARQEVESLRALHRQKLAELESAQEEIAYFESEFERAESLKKQGHVSSANHDKSRRDLMMARHQVEAIRQEIYGVLASLGGESDGPIEDHPMVMEALTEWDRAQLDLLRTRVIAPTESIVSNIDLQKGEYVEAGTPVFSLVDVARVWVEANLKETDLTHVRVGQQAKVTVDAYPDHSWQAQVTGIAPATGAEFALLPPQNASGNWVKVVQRVPVRLELERRPGDPPLRAGMSVEVEIDTKVERSLPGPFGTALAWIRGER
ncbi:MAG: HlyD family secretion protein [Kiloniellales bacterium]|nr:HlyD family secretion protein [Kiloniellales bacterium]